VAALSTYKPDIGGFAVPSAELELETQGRYYKGILRKDRQGVARIMIIPGDRRIKLSQPEGYKRGQWDTDKEVLLQELRSVAQEHISADANEYDLVERLMELDSKLQ
jgi:hypothetical protein